MITTFLDLFLVFSSRFLVLLLWGIEMLLSNPNACFSLLVFTKSGEKDCSS